MSKTASKKSGFTKKIVVALCMVLAFAFGAFTGNGIAQNQAEENLASAAEQWQENAAAEAAARSEAANLSFIVTAQDISDSEVTAVVHITGESDDNTGIDDYYRAEPDTPYVLDYDAGIYLIELSEDDIDNDGKVYKHDAIKVAYADEKSLQVELELAIDEEKTKAQEEARLKAEKEAQEKKEAEEKAKQEAEEKAKREAEEKAQKEAEEQAKREAEEAEAAATATTMTRSMTKGSQEGYTVYITDTGEKYHHAGCQYLKDSQIPIDINDAQARGYQPCKRCFGG